MIEAPPDRTRLQLVLAAALWATALLFVLLGARLRLKPLLVLGLLDGVMAALLTVFIFNRRRRNR